MSEISIDFGPVIRHINNVNDNLGVINDNMRIVGERVDDLDQNVSTLDTKVEQLMETFMAFVVKDAMDKELQRAMTDVIRIRQELEKKFGYYDEIRRRTTGILQAVDVSIVRKETITSCTEELMLAAPNYWLAPCLIALAAWINDNRELANKAINEALRRDDEKTSLLFALINRRATRFNTSEVWLERYFSMQDPTALVRDMVVVIDAFAGGLFGGDSHGNCSRQIKGWITELAERVGFVEEQHRQWSDALLSKMRGGANGHYQYLAKYSPTWVALDNALTASRLNQIIYDYFENVFSGAITPSPTLAAEVDNLLEKLVTNFDDEELGLRREERLTSLIIEERGDRDSAQRRFDLEKVALTERFSFTQLLTNAAMHPETSHASKATQRLSIAMSKEWIIKAYEDITAKNRAAIPVDISIAIESWSGATRDGANETELLNSVTSHIQDKLTAALAEIKLDVMSWFALVGGIILTVFGIKSPTSVFMIIVGLGGIAWFVKSYLGLEARKTKTTEEHEQLKQKYQDILKATLAETVDVRREIAVEDAKYGKVMQFLEGITPQQFVSSNYSSRMIAA